MASGVVLGLLAVAFALVGVGLLIRSEVPRDEDSSSRTILALASLLVGVLSLPPALRLIRGVRRTDGGLFSPTVLFVLGFALLAGAVIQLAIGDPIQSVSPGAFGLATLGLAWRRRRTREHGGLLR